MNQLILNRDNQSPTEGWHQFEVPGEHINHKAKVVQVIDGKAINSIVNRFNQEAKVDNFSGLLVDRDHFSLDPNQTSEAMGWMTDMRLRAGSIEGKIDWTAVGKPLVESAPNQAPTFKFFSTVYNPSDWESLGERKVGNQTYKVVRPLRLDRLALTNDPNNKGQRPIGNRAEGAPPVWPSFKRAIGLPEDAAEDEVVERVQEIKNRANRDLTALKLEYVQLRAEGDKTRAEIITNRAKQLKAAAPARTFNECWNQAQGETIRLERPIK